LMVACASGARVLDLAHDGKVVGTMTTGAGVDNIDYSPRTKLLYIASGKDATLTIARVGDAKDGVTLTTVATAPTAPGARVVVVDSDGNAYVADSQGGRILKVNAPH